VDRSLRDLAERPFCTTQAHGRGARTLAAAVGGSPSCRKFW
jgi:hypothetical protein